MNLTSNLLLLILLALPVVSLAKTAIPEILGTWNFEGPRATEDGEPRKQMNISFDERGLSDLVSWAREQEGVCRRSAHFWFDEENQTLVQTTIGLDPSSPVSCEEVEEMRIGTETRHQIRFENDRMILTKNVNGKPKVSEWSFAFP